MIARVSAAGLIAHRLRAHRLTAPARTLGAAASALTATQSQDFWGGRWGLALRTAGGPTLSAVDRAFDRGELVRTWTMRGTLHIVAPRDLGWILAVTGERMLRSAFPRHRELGLDTVALARAETILRGALAGVNALSRAEAFEALAAGGVDPVGQRGYHVLVALAVRGILCWGPVVARAGSPTREQRLVLVEEWVTDAAAPADPSLELFVRYIAGHGPATARDFAWWAGLPLGAAREASERAAVRVRRIDVDGEPMFAPLDLPRARPERPAVIALPSFDEYYLSYADRTRACAPDRLDSVGPSKNGMVRPTLLVDGRIAGVWNQPLASARPGARPTAELFDARGRADVDDADVSAALDRFHAFITG